MGGHTDRCTFRYEQNTTPWFRLWGWASTSYFSRGQTKGRWCLTTEMTHQRKFSALDVFAETKPAPGSHPPSLRASEVFILGNGSVNVDKLSRGIYSIMRSFLKLPLNERLWMGKGSEILPLLCHQNGTVLINPVSPGRIFKFLFIF